MPSGISNHMPSSKVWDEIAYPLPNFNGPVQSLRKTLIVCNLELAMPNCRDWWTGLFIFLSSPSCVDSADTNIRWYHVCWYPTVRVSSGGKLHGNKIVWWNYIQLWQMTPRERYSHTAVIYMYDVSLTFIVFETSGARWQQNALIMQC